MCGILSIAGHHAGAKTANGQLAHKGAVEAALATLARRGPDDHGMLAFPGCILAQTRLSIIDLSERGHQPMADNERPLAIAFNGEIYNYQALRAELAARGHRFASQSDTEVILKAYAEWGERCPERLDGMFAFIIWDEAAKTLFMARDRFGEKPLYYHVTGGDAAGSTAHARTLVVGSEIKALLATGMVPAEIDLTSVDNYLTFMCVPPWRSIYKGVSPLPPAHSATWKDGTLSVRRYWKLTKTAPSAADTAAGMDEAAATVRRMLAASVKSRMVADVEVGTLLSGGTDSSIITLLSQKAVGASAAEGGDGSGRKVKAFSAGFDRFIDELPYARQAAAAAGVELHERQIKADLLAAFLDTVAYFDEPFGDSSNVPVQLISEFARERVKVVLSGDGGDELFWGYGHYSKHWHLRKYQKVWQKLFSDPFAHFKRTLQTFPLRERQALWRNEHAASAVEADPLSHIDLSEARTPLEKINLVDFSLFLPADMLTKVDRSAMMRSLEVRSPFLNHELAQYAFNLPPRFKSVPSQNKLILDKAFGGFFPDGFFRRKKQGFNAPIKVWLRDPELRAYVDKTLLGREGGVPRIAAFLKADEVERLVRRFYDGDDALQYRVWTLLCLEAWMRTHQR